MEFFDFNEAASGSHVPDDDVASDHIEMDENDAVETYQSFLQDQSEFPDFLPGQSASEEVMAETPDPEGIYPMGRAEEPCDFCRNMGLDCFIAKRGVMQKSGCTCCISLYRECSFTQTMPQGRFAGVDTLHPISENIYIPTGGLTGKKALKSFSGIAEDVDARARKSSSRLSREAVRILKAWLNDHSDHPYPTEEEKEELKLRTGLKRTQITNWLANARRRGKIRPSPRSSSPVAGAIEIPRQPAIDHTLMTPLERWKYSPPENEPAALSNILRALEDTPLEIRQGSQLGHVRSHSRRTGSSNDSSHANSNVFDASSLVSSHDASQSASHSSISDLSFASAFSHRSSLGSFGSMERKERRRRRKPSLPANTFNQQKAKGARIYQCTFCADSFQTKYDWQRHEKSLHLALEKWTCAPHGGVAFINGANRCVFCMAIDPDNDHLETHNYSTCAEKSSAERTFYRKDHLNQHLRLMHNVRFHPSMDQWRSHTTEIISRCGFCGITLTTWKGRADHLATHFKNGADMVQWKGDWGFEPVVQDLVENAMPPYLIGHERNTLDPYRPSAHKAAPGLAVPMDANCYERLKMELNAYIQESVTNGIVPTDQMLQDHGRRVIYGTDDPWNQTCADNPVWLSILKRDAGLEPAAGSEHIQFSNLGMQPPYASQEGLRRPPVCTRQRYGSGYPTSGFQSLAIPGTGRSSAAPSVPGSSAGSFSGSAGMFTAPGPSGLSLDWGSNASAGVSSFSTPLSTSADPFVQMGFDPEFLQQLNHRYEEEVPLDSLQGLSFGVDDGSGFDAIVEPVGTAAVTSSATAPIPIPALKQPDIRLPDAIPPDLHFEGTGRTGV
ncbi:hypothetical protein BDW72DRAFT_66019 [Aspergillus terricola var. indicus]